MGAPILIVGAMVCFYIPRGICFGDYGEFQLASMTLGIMHPPGYAWLATLGHVVSLLPVANKPLLISLATLGSGLVVLWFCALIQIRLGLHAVVAIGTTLLFAAHKRFWFNAIMPEVYMPALLFLVIAVYLLLRYASLVRLRDLMGSALCLGISMSTRPPAILMIPFFMIAFWSAGAHLGLSFRRRAKGLALAAAFALLPVVYSFVFFVIRDTTSATYNYIESYNSAHTVLPDTSDGVSARVRRIVWLVTAEQFQPEFGTTWSGFRSKFRWLRHDLLYGHSIQLVLASIVALAGLMRCFRTSTPAAWLLLGMMLHSAFFVFIYRVYGQAADLSSFVFASLVLLGAALAPLFPRSLSRVRLLCVVVLVPVCVITTWQSANLPQRWRAARDVDAVPFLTELDLATIPQDALILSGWSQAVPLWYAFATDVERPDVEVFSGEIGQWDAMYRDAGGRPVLTVHKRKSVDGRPLEPYRNLYRVVPEHRAAP